MTDLPAGWEWVRLGDIADVQGGIQKQQKRRPAENKFPFLRVANVGRGTLQLDDVHEIELFDGEIDKFRLEVGDLLVVEGNGSPAHIGRAAMWHGELENCVHQNHLIRVRPLGAVSSRYLELLWNSPLVADQLQRVASTTSGLYTLNVSKIRAVELPLAPAAEQSKIAEWLDEHLSRLDAAEQAFRDGLERQKSLVKRVIVDAVPVPGPGHWRLTTVGKAGKVDLGRQRHPDWHHGPNMRPYLRVANVFEDMIDVSSLMEMDFAPEIWERFRLSPGDILLNEGQSPEYLGRPAMYKGFPPDVAFTNSLIRFRAHEDVLPEWALLVFRRHMHAGRFMSEQAITTNIAHLSAGRFKSVEFPIPSIEEQQEIVKVVDEHLTKLAHVRAATQNARNRVADLRRSMLERAFAGRLVQQDEHCEPASALLAQIAGDRAGRPRQRRPTKAAPRHSNAAGTFVQEEIPL